MTGLRYDVATAARSISFVTASGRVMSDR